MLIGKGLKESRVDRVMTGASWPVDGEEVRFFGRCNNIRPMMDAIVVTNIRIVGLLGKDMKTSRLLHELKHVNYDAKGRRVEVAGLDGEVVAFKSVAPEDLPAVQLYVEAGRQGPVATSLVDRVAQREANDPRTLALDGPLGKLSSKAQRKLLPALSDGEHVLVAIEGEFAAMVATDRRLLITKWGITSGSFISAQVNSWDLRNVSGIEVRKGMTTSSIVVQSAGTVPVTKFGRMDKGPGTVWEAPNALFAEPSKLAATADGTRLTIAEAANRLRDLVAEAQNPPAPLGEPTPASVTQAPASPTMADQIRELGQLRDEGLVTDEEFEAKKRLLLGL